MTEAELAAYPIPDAVKEKGTAACVRYLRDTYSLTRPEVCKLLGVQPKNIWYSWTKEPAPKRWKGRPKGPIVPKLCTHCGKDWRG